MVDDRDLAYGVPSDNEPGNESEFLYKARELFSFAASWDINDRRLCISDHEFEAGNQWDAGALAQRNNQGRPTLTINKLRKKVEVVVGEYTQSRIQFKVIPNDGGASKEAADILSKYLTTIQRECNAGYAYEWGFRQCIIGGRGFWRVACEYPDDSSFDEVPVVKRILDSTMVAFDPYCKTADYSDMKYAFITEAIGKTDFLQRYPDKDPNLAGPMFDNSLNTDAYNFYYGGIDNCCYVTEYYWIEEEKDELRRVSVSMTNSDGIEEVIEVVDVNKRELAKLRKIPGAKIATVGKMKRPITRKKVMWAKISAGQILDEPREVPCDFIPLIFCPGIEEIRSNGRGYVSMIRDSKDSARSYNYARSTSVENISLAPKSPYVLTSNMIKGHEAEWDTMNTFPRPYLLYNPDPMAPNGQPMRIEPPQVQAALTSEAVLCDQEIKETTGVYDAATGQVTNEVSARAIQSRVSGTLKSNFAFFRSLERAIIHTGRVMVSMLNHIDVEGREFIYTDQSEKAVDVVIKGVRTGKFKVALDTSPEYETQRREILEGMRDYLRQVPQTSAALADIVAEASDWPESGRIAERVRRTIPINLLSVEEAKERAFEEAQIQKAVLAAQQAVMGNQPQQPTPEMQIEAQKAAAELEKQRLEIEKMKIDLEIQKLKASEQAMKTEEQKTITDSEAYGMGFNTKEFEKMVTKKLASLLKQSGSVDDK